MSAPAGEDLRELERELTVAAESGEPLTLAAVQELLGAGHDDATAALETLREHGKAVEVAPGEWSGPTLDEMDAAAATAEPPRVMVTADVPEDEPDTLTADGRPPQWHLVPGASQPNVRLTMAIATALDAEPLGHLVKAAIEGLEQGETFVLEITP